jgi:hypothetical protein
MPSDDLQAAFVGIKEPMSELPIRALLIYIREGIGEEN